MTAVLDLERAVLGDLGAAVLVLLCDDGEGEEAVELRDGGGELLEDGDILGEDGQDFVEELLFEAAGALVAAQDLALELFELVRRVAFAVRERLTAHIGVRHLLLEGVAHLDVVAEHAVEAHLQSADARAFALARSRGRRCRVLALRPDVAERIERLVVAAADEVPPPCASSPSPKWRRREGRRSRAYRQGRQAIERGADRRKSPTAAF